MNTNLGRSLLAGVFGLTLALPAWAAEQAKEASATQEIADAKSVNSAEIKKLQEALKGKGEDPGAIDGRMGRKTHAAVRAFQKSNGLKVTGKLDQETADKLGIQLATTSESQGMKENKK